MSETPSRRDFLKTSAATAAAIGTVGPVTSAMGPAPEPVAVDGGSIYMRKLGVKPVINGVGVVTSLGGSIMPPEVVEAMVEASRSFVSLTELQEKVGARVAELLSVPAAMVSCGAASAITCATAACAAGGEVEKVRQLPDTTGLKNEIVQQKSHRSGYEAQMTLVGSKIVWVESRRELDEAIGERTAMMFFLNKADPDGQIGRKEWIEVGRQRGVPTFNDAASDVPPPERLSQYVREGFDLVAFSGGKGLLGPQATGFLLGRADLIRAAQTAISPHGGIGRGMKVGKEEMMGALVALERYLKVDHAAERRELDRRTSTWGTWWCAGTRRPSPCRPKRSSSASGPAIPPSGCRPWATRGSASRCGCCAAASTKSSPAGCANCSSAPDPARGQGRADRRPVQRGRGQLPHPQRVPRSAALLAILEAAEALDAPLYVRSATGTDCLRERGANLPHHGTALNPGLMLAVRGRGSHAFTPSQGQAQCGTLSPRVSARPARVRADDITKVQAE